MMRPMLSTVEARVVGCLLEKEVTTPDVYPLTLNALATACNQSTNRDPLTQLGSSEIEAALLDMKTRGFIRVVHSQSNRATKYRQVANEKLDLDEADRALVCVLLLRGAQTAAELRTRTERLHPFASVQAVEDRLAALAQRAEPLAQLLERQPGQKEARWIELISDEPWINSGSGSTGGSGSSTGRSSASTERIEALEARVGELEAIVARLLAELGEA
jgi:uncharacterized protein YceH (UPF0502 family)